MEIFVLPVLQTNRAVSGVTSQNGKNCTSRVLSMNDPAQTLNHAVKMAGNLFLWVQPSFTERSFQNWHFSG